ncbi:sulfatase-like hydrolase/transferase [Zobellia amurskyensis]|nr:sulfatase-like hydrolase/transferase [Zobellia amurskyensis]
MKIKLKFLLLVMLGFTLVGYSQSKTDNTFEAPNILVILLDDAGYVDFGFMGSKDLSTPEIDKLASSGTIFTDAHVSATVCAPSRAGLLTGKYQQRFGFEANGTGGIGLSNDVETMADVFNHNGYNTYAIGKWHLGEEPSDHPNQRGFQEFYGFIGGSRSYFPIENPSQIDMLQHNGKRVKLNGYMTDALGDMAVNFINKKRNKPFFMYLSFNAVHTPMEAKEEDLAKFKGHPRQALAAMTWSLDENIGKVVRALKNKGVVENTLVFFLSDNGGAHNNQSSTGPLKGWKGNKFEGGHRVPFVVSWPGQLPSGNSLDGLTSSLDIFSTAVKAANIEVDDELILDGVNLLPYLKKAKSGSPHEKLFWRKLDESAVRMGNKKLIALKGFGNVMYDLKNDLGETFDLTRVLPTEKSQIEQEYIKWETELMKPLWDEGPIWMPITRHIHKSLMSNEEPEYKDPWGKK